MTEGGETLTIQVATQFVIQRSLLGMEKRKEEFLKIVCQIYMAAILVVLPLYYIPGNGYYKLGDSKYYLYRNISLICMGMISGAGSTSSLAMCSASATSWQVSSASCTPPGAQVLALPLLHITA